MNKVQLIGRLTKDPDLRQTTGEKPMSIARYTLAIDRRFNRRDEQTADFINCVAFGNAADFSSSYFKKGLKVAVTGHLQSGSYTNKDGIKVYTTDVVIEDQEFVESKNSSKDGDNVGGFYNSDPGDLPEGFNDIPDEDLPFN